MDYITKDSGERLEFTTGSLRDTQKGKPRIDLIDLGFFHAVGRELHEHVENTPPYLESYLYDHELILQLRSVQRIPSPSNVVTLTAYFINIHANKYEDTTFLCIPTTTWESMGNLLARGAEKYGANNWRKGQSLARSYSSMIRHFMQFYAGDVEEDHYSAVIFNLMSMWHVLSNKEDMPDELFDLGAHCDNVR